MPMLDLRALIQENRVCAILRRVPLNTTVRYARALYDGGIRMFEVALNSENAYRQIQRLREEFDGAAWIGAGTATDPERCTQALSAGAQFFLTPSADRGTLKFCADHDVPLLPGVMTPTDVAVCLSYGYTTLKLFPAGDMPLHYIHSLKGPFDGTEYVAVGGVSPENVRRFFEAGFIGVGMGSNLAPADLVREERWEEIAQCVRAVFQTIQGAGK